MRLYFLPGLLLAACFEQPSYEGRLCSEDDPCPEGLICFEQRCSTTITDRDAGVPPVFDDASTFPDVISYPDAITYPDATIDAGIDDSGEPPHAIQIATRNKHDLVLKSDGTVWAWGWNEHGEVEAAPFTERRAPVKIALADVVRVEAGGVMSYAITANGELYAWGRNRAGELGNTMTGVDQNPTPVLVQGLPSAIRDLAAGYDFALVLLDDNTVWAFGANTVFQLGRTDVTSSAVPMMIEGLDDVEKIAAGSYHGVALKTDGTVWTWGYNEYGQLGEGSNMNALAPPIQAHGANNSGVLTSVLDVSAGWGHTIAVVQGGSVYAWGWNGSGQLGDNTNVDRAYPGVVLNTSGSAPLANIVEVRAGFTFNLARTGSEDLYGFGFNMYAQLGDGSAITRSLPAPVLLANGDPIGSVVAFRAGGDNAIMMTRDHTVWTWGSNMFGELGDGQTANAAYPQPVVLPN